MDTRTLQSRSAPSLGAHRRLRVGVLVDLPLGAGAGGHVRCWERLADAARDFSDELDLTVHFMGTESACRDLSETVHYRIEAPVFSTSRLPFLSHVPDHTDLAPFHPRLARQLPGYDVIHTTDAYFAYARTAMKVARRRDIPIVNSIHTNTPEYARLFTAQTIERLFGDTFVSSVLLSRLQVAQRMERRMLRQLVNYQRQCAYALVSRPDQLDSTRATMNGRVGLLRRGIDRATFHPARRDRAWLAERHGIPPERLTILAAGRLNRGKNILLLAEAVAMLIDRGIDAHLVCAGDGEDRAAVMAQLGPRATCPGSVAPEELARLYASADLFALPSRIEESANVLLEALASGLPVLVARDSGMGRAVRENETGILLPGNDSNAWSQALRDLAERPATRLAMSHAARDYAESDVPSWQDVLAQDLLPHWQEAARHRHRNAA
ncbi:MAG TPA: glycosyltransferase [Stellaceae bacterium]|jgi:glycosyltransferase involved in cell wall biosynthesis